MNREMMGVSLSPQEEECGFSTRGWRDREEEEEERMHHHSPSEGVHQHWMRRSRRFLNPSDDEIEVRC